jgi:hypothetical protein
MKGKIKATEWIGSLVALPTFISNENEHYRPEALIWMDGNELIQGFATEKPGVLLPQAGEHLNGTIANPMCGGSKPKRVRVASSELARVLRQSHPSMEIVCAPTPEIDAVLEHMRSTMGDATEQEEPAYLSPGVTPAMMASFFNAAAALFRAQPWKIVPDDHSLIQITSEPLELHNAVICVIGQLGESHGVLLFECLSDFNAYINAALNADEDSTELPQGWPRFFSINFEPVADISPAARKEVATHHWEVADHNAYPWPMTLEEDLLAHPPTASELLMLEAVARAVTQLLADPTALRAGWQGGQPVSRAFTVVAQGHSVELTLGTLAADSIPSDPFTDLRELEMASDELDPAARAPLERALLNAFANSAEGRNCTLGGHTGLVMDLAANYLGVTIASMDGEDLREVLFEVLPRKVSIDASAAPYIIEELRTFYQYLKSAHDFSEAEDCLRVLGRSATTKLAAALSDRSNFGMAKSLLMGAREAGFDMTSQEGMEAFMRSVQGKPLPRSIRMPFDPPSAAAPRNAGKTKTKAKNKEKRKAAQASKRKNR